MAVDDGLDQHRFGADAADGLSCGLAPCPMLALLLAQTLRHGPREGCKIALPPLVLKPCPSNNSGIGAV